MVLSLRSAPKPRSRRVSLPQDEIGLSNGKGTIPEDLGRVLPKPSTVSPTVSIISNLPLYSCLRCVAELDLQELKQRAYNHIIKSLTVENVAYEVFSDFSAAFEDVRKVRHRGAVVVVGVLIFWPCRWKSPSSLTIGGIFAAQKRCAMSGSRSDWVGTQVSKKVRDGLSLAYAMLIPRKHTVWPLIALNLEFRPHSPGAEGRDVPTERS